MESALLPGTVLNSRYQIIKTVVWRLRGGVYEAWDIKVTDRRWIIKEIIPPRMPEDELEKRREYFFESLDVLMSLDHPNMAKIVDYFSEMNHEYVVIEHIDGITLKHFVGVIEKLRERQVLEIAMTLCDAMNYLQNRPKPLVFENMDTDHVMFDYDRNIKFVGYELTKFFTAEFPYKNYYDSSEEIEGLIYKISRISLFLIGGGSEGNDNEVPGDLNISKSFRRLLKGTLYPNQKQFSSIPDYRKALDMVYDPEKYKKIAREMEEQKQEKLKVMNVNHAWQAPVLSAFGFAKRIARKLISQGKWAILTELIGIVVIIYVLLLTNYAGKVTYKAPLDTPIVYVTAGSELFSIREDDYRIVDRRAIGINLGGLYYKTDPRPEIIAAESGGAALYRIDPMDNSVIDTINVSNNPTFLAGDNEDNILYALHPDENMVSVVDLNENRLKGIIGSVLKPVDMRYMNGLKALVVSNSGSNDILITNLQMEREGTARRLVVGNVPSALSISPDEKYIITADSKNDNVIMIDTANDYEVYKHLYQIGGEKVSCIEMDTTQDRIWFTFAGTHNIVLYNITLVDVEVDREIGKQPERIKWGSNNEKIWLIDKGMNQVMVYGVHPLVEMNRIDLPHTPGDVLIAPVIDPSKYREE